MRLGIFGGSFDPVHNGHLALARACHEQAALDEVWFTPTAIQPLKQLGPHATDAQRVEMLKLAIDTSNPFPLSLGESRGEGEAPVRRADDSWRVCTLEIDRGGYSYTVDTLRQLHTELPDTRLFFMIGADVIRDVAQWKDPAEVFRLATPLVVRRAGQPDPNVASITSLCTTNTQPQLIEMPAVNISSSEIRCRLATSEAIEDMLPAAVAEYITQNGLYR